MNRKTKRLILSKETVQNLEDGQLRLLAGAATHHCSAVDACPTRLCPSIALAC